MDIITVTPNNLHIFLNLGSHIITEEEFNIVPPDEAFYIEQNEIPCGRAAIWYKNTPTLNTNKIGFIGYIEGSDESVVKSLITFGETLLKKNSCNLAVGPVDGSTWKSYRANIKNTEGANSFLGDTYYKKNTAERFISNNYFILSTYYSSSIKNLHTKDERFIRFSQRNIFQNFSTRGFDKTKFSQELELLYSLSINSFSKNFLYTQISKEDFFKLYSKFESILEDKYVRFVLYKNKECGFIFSYPDKKSSALIVKTLSVLQEYQGMGAGSILLEEINNTAVNNGFSQIIHALMHSNNSSLKLSKKYGTPISEYQLFGKELS